MNRRGFVGAMAGSAFGAPAGAEKRLMVHADDIGMCHSVNLAAMDALANGSVSSASINRTAVVALMTSPSYRVNAKPDGWLDPWMLTWQFTHDPAITNFASPEARP